jgi:hypothetical protein
MHPSDTVVQLVTRIPVTLRRRAKLHCVLNDTTLTRFVIEALTERLNAEASTSQRPVRRVASR